MTADRMVSHGVVSTTHWVSACDIGCLGEAGWGSAIRASGRSDGNGGITDPYHSLGCISSAGDISHEMSLLAYRSHCDEGKLSMRCYGEVRFDQDEGVFWEA